LTDAQLTMGTTDEPLKQCLELIADEEKPDFVLVLGTCPVEVIGSVFNDVVLDVSKRTGIPMIPLKTSGLRLSSQQEMLDWLYQTLASLDIEKAVEASNGKATAQRGLRALWRRHFGIEAEFGESPDAHLKVNLLGLPPGRHPEMKWLLEGMGIHVQGCYPVNASADDWLRIRQATHTFVVDPGMFPRLLECLRSNGQEIHEIPAPIGSRHCLEAIDTIAKACGRQEQANRLTAPIREQLEAEARTLKQDWAGKRFAVVTRMRNSYQIQSVSSYGLGHLPAFLDTGMAVSLLIQGAPDQSVQDSYREILDAMGFSIPFHMFSSPFELEELLKKHRFDAICVADQGRHAARNAETPSIDPNRLQPGLCNVLSNLKLIDDCLSRGRN